VNRLLEPEGYTPSMRDLFPCHYLRAELLKALRYSEVSYRKYCKDVINRMDSKDNELYSPAAAPGSDHRPYPVEPFS